MAQNGNWLVEVKPWYVVGNTDDNPDITKYMGYYRLKVGYQLGEAILSAQGQYNWNTGYGGAELGVSYPITNMFAPIRRFTAAMASRLSTITLTKRASASG